MYPSTALHAFPAFICVVVCLSACLITMSLWEYFCIPLLSPSTPWPFLPASLNRFSSLKTLQPHALHFKWLQSHVWFILPLRLSALMLSSHSLFLPFRCASLIFSLRRSAILIHHLRSPQLSPPPLSCLFSFVYFSGYFFSLPLSRCCHNNGNCISDTINSQYSKLYLILTGQKMS